MVYILRKNSSLQTVSAIVDFGDSFLEIPERFDYRDRPKDFFATHTVIGAHIFQPRCFDKNAITLSAAKYFGAMFHRFLNPCLNSDSVVFADNRTQTGCFVLGITRFQSLSAFDKFRYKRIID